MEHLSIQASSPKYVQLAENLRRMIAQGELKPGTRLPSFSEMKQLFDATQRTVEKAHDLLEEDGLIRRETGRGAFVCDPADTVKAPTNHILKVGMVVPPDILHSGLSGYLRGLLAGLTQQHPGQKEIEVRLLLADEFYNGVGRLHYAAALQDGSIDALVMTLYELSSADLKLLKACRLPIAFAGLACPDARWPLVRSDLASGVETLVDFLCRQSQTDIGLLLGGRKGRTSAAFLAGAASVLAQHGLLDGLAARTAYLSQDYIENLRDRLRIPGMVRQLVEAGAKAIVCADDEMAIGAISALEEMGLSVPGDVVVTGANDTALSPDFLPLTTLRLPLEAMGNAIRDRIWQQIQGGTNLPPVIAFKPELIVRESAPSHENMPLTCR